MKTVLDLTSVKAYEYFMESTNYCTMDLPIYISFKPILNYVAKKVGNHRIDEILADPKKMPSKYENVNHKLFIKKDAKYTYRPIQITNPYIYYCLVKIMTNRRYWKEIKERFKAFLCPNIEVSSIPKVKGKRDKSHGSASVTSWWENLEQRSIALSLYYRYMFVTDITNCYGSIYTHTIAWALMGKDEAKKKKGNMDCLGNIIDNYIQAMQYQQTNGIPQGSTLYDLIAEMILGYADMQLSDKLKTEGITDYRILRFRDDYRVFSNSKEELEKIVYYLQEVLSDLNFQLNSKKTLMTEEVVQMSVKPDKLAGIVGRPLYKKQNKKIVSTASSFQEEALYIHQFAKEYPNSGRLIKLLDTFSRRITTSKNPLKEVDAEIMIAIFTEIALGSPKAYKLVLHLISHLVNKLSTTVKRESTVQAVYKKFEIIPNIGELQIWMQHITYKMSPCIPYTEAICRIVANEPDVELWNNEWVSDAYKDKFPQYKICTNWLRDSFTPVIDIDEVSLFDY